MVVTGNSMLLVDLGEAVSEAVEVVGVLALHLGLDNVNWVVAHGRAEAGKHTSREVNEHLLVRVLAQLLLRFTKDEEADALV